MNYIGHVRDERLLTEDLKSMDVRPALAVKWWNTSALGLWLPTTEEWDARTPYKIASSMEHVLAAGEAALRIYSNKNGELARRTETHGRLAGWTRARHLMFDDPIESATVTEIAEIPLWHGRTLPILRLMEHGNGDDEFIMSMSDLAHYVQRDRAEIAIT